MPAHPDDHGAVEGSVGLSITAAVESMTSVRLARASGDGTRAAKFGERGFVANAFTVVAGGDEHLGGDVDPDPEGLEQTRRGSASERLELACVRLELACVRLD